MTIAENKKEDEEAWEKYLWEEKYRMIKELSEILEDRKQVEEMLKE